MPSKALLSDFLIDALRLLVTDELLNEIAREKDSEQREKSRNKAHEFPRIDYDAQLAGLYEGVLKTFLPSNSPSQESDIRQLAQTSASEVKIFVTQDQALLKKSTEIAARVSVEVVSPTELIIQLHELSEKQSYAPTRIAGFELSWQRLSSEEVARFPYNSFLSQGERQGIFREKLGALLARPYHYEAECLQSKDEIVAVRILTKNSNQTLTVPLMRVAQSAEDRSLFGRFVIADTVAKAVEENLDLVKINVSALMSGFESDLLEMGFTKCRDNFVRFCFSHSLTRTELLSEIHKLIPGHANYFQRLPELELQKCCSPLHLKDAVQNYFLIPIRPGYAKSLIDRDQAATDMFVHNSGVLLRWDNVYYKVKSHHRMLQAPARILWYESGDTAGHIAAISCLDAVEIDTAKVLFRKFKKFGILEWKDIFDMCEGDPSKEIMALRFSHTFPFRKPVSLDAIRKVFDEHGAKPVLQSPYKLPTEIFCKLFPTGISGHIMNETTPLLFSLKPHYADLVFDGLKQAELRRRITPFMKNRDVYIYVSSPVQCLRGGFRVGHVWSGSPEEIWNEVSDLASVDKQDFDAYYAGRTIAYALKITDVWEYVSPLDLTTFEKTAFPRFVVPQSWRYARAEECRSFCRMKRRPQVIQPPSVLKTTSYSVG